MAEYQTIAKKYRPKIFDDVCEQRAIVKTLKNAIHQNRVSQAYLFCGHHGCGKTTIARLFAKALNCQSLTDTQEPCNQCPSCLEITSGSSLDVIEIDGASNRGIDDIRQLNETIGYAPAHGRYKIYIIDEVHMLTKEAFNALLKTLEEPPSTVKFFFATTEPHKILPTILSRCQRFDLKRISFDAMVKKLTFIADDLKVEVQEEVLRLIAKFSEGSMRDAESLLDQILCGHDQPIKREDVIETLGMVKTEHFFHLDKAMFSHDLGYAFSLSHQLFSSGCHLGHFIEELFAHFRQLLMAKLHAEKGLAPTLSENERSEYLSHAAQYSQDQLLGILEILSKWEEKRSGVKQIYLETLLLNLLKSMRQMRVESLVDRLLELEGKFQAPKKPTAPAVEPEKSIPPAAKEAPAPSKPLSFSKQTRYETLLRFGAVELNGSVKK